MKPSISLEHLKKAPQYLSHLDEANLSDTGFSFLSYIKEVIPLDVLSVFITNYNHNNSNIIYVLRLERDKLELYESNANTENNIQYSFLDESITLNKKPMSNIYKLAFKKRLTDIIKDLKLNKCELFEETL
ncbi:hypothetical protein CL657_03765 [bacterium]|nr:hypothetical protein [bacterium]